MDEFQRNVYAAALRSKQADLLTGLNNREALTAEAEPDVFDEIQPALDRALVIQTLDRNSRLLRDVRTAFERIRDGSYGQCLQCEEEINPKRLVAVPWARFCLKCQEQADSEEREHPTDVGFLSASPMDVPERPARGYFFREPKNRDPKSDSVNAVGID